MFQRFEDELLMTPGVRIGIGYDIHRLVEGRRLVLGGVEIPFDKGLLGHSDSDVLTHAICDALLGAAALGDIGTHFPDTDPRWAGASSFEFLAAVIKLIAARGYQIGNVDATVLAERPKLKPHIQVIRERLASVLGLNLDQVSLKAKTAEGLESVGRGEAIAAQAVALLSSK
jgi:2-C-methyl-D-erythritol 2,4-cyclodiphosphate synthase